MLSDSAMFLLCFDPVIEIKKVKLGDKIFNDIKEKYNYSGENIFPVCVVTDYDFLYEKKCKKYLGKDCEILCKGYQTLDGKKCIPALESTVGVTISIYNEWIKFPL